jgi:uncharacterized protein YecT (DUF1311 family)
MKKLIVILMTWLLILSVSACGNTSDSNDNDCCNGTEAAGENGCCNEEISVADFPTDIPDCCG